MKTVQNLEIELLLISIKSVKSNVRVNYTGSESLLVILTALTQCDQQHQQYGDTHGELCHLISASLQQSVNQFSDVDH